MKFTVANDPPTGHSIAIRKNERTPSLSFLGKPTINDIFKSELHPSDLLTEFAALWEEADRIWDHRRNEPAFHGYVSADYLSIYEMLLEHRSGTSNLLEWGSGLGVVTIMASRMGLEAYGIEAEPGLVELSRTLAEKYAPKAVFAEGSFIPDDFEWNPSDGEDVDRTEVDSPAAYYLLDMEIRDFDIVYAYPWPDEHQFFHAIFQQYGRPDARFATYDSREGLQLAGRDLDE